MKKYTVISIVDSSGETLADHVKAPNGLAAFYKVASDREGTDISFVVAIEGELSTENGLTFPSESCTVASEDVLDQPEVFK